MTADERVLCIPAAHIFAAGEFTGFRHPGVWIDTATFTYQPRSTCETDPTFLQLIPYVVLRYRDSVFHYGRGASGTEGRLCAKRSVGIGGHIADIDAGAADPFRAGMLRELAEEIDIGSGFSEHFLGFIFDPSTPVGEVHLGVVYRFALDAPAVTAKEDGIADGGFATVAGLRAHAGQFETWSQLVLAAL